MFGYIYKTTNLINNKIYVGKKKSDHFLNEKYLGSGSIFRQALNRYGKENFNVELIDTADSEDELNEKEKYWIEYFNARDLQIGYNIHKGGAGGIHYPRVYTDVEAKKRSASLKKAYQEGRHKVIRITGKKLRKRTAEENAANSARQRDKKWLISPDGSRETTAKKEDIDALLAAGWKFGRKPLNSTIWNLDKTKETDSRLAQISANRKSALKENGSIGCYGLSGKDNKNYKSDEYIKENIIEKGFENIWTKYGKESVRNFFHIGFSVFDRCMEMCNLTESKEHRSEIRKNKKGMTEEMIQKELQEMYHI